VRGLRTGFSKTSAFESVGVVLSGRHLVKAGSAGLVLGAVPFALFGLATGAWIGDASDPSRDMFSFLLCAGIGILGAIGITVVHDRAVRKR
jgi:hypothetical protein